MQDGSSVSGWIENRSVISTVLPVYNIMINQQEYELNFPVWIHNKENLVVTVSKNNKKKEEKN